MSVPGFVLPRPKRPDNLWQIDLTDVYRWQFLSEHCPKLINHQAI